MSAGTFWQLIVRVLVNVMNRHTASNAGNTWISVVSKYCSVHLNVMPIHLLSDLLID